MTAARPSYSERFTEQYGGYVASATIRRVWAAVTATPRASVRDLAHRERLPVRAVQVALHVLRDAGYIDFAARSCRARTILVPFYITGVRP
jgi:galactokinase/mevalonate kinase-like predicted kinase